MFVIKLESKEIYCETEDMALELYSFLLDYKEKHLRYIMKDGYGKTDYSYAPSYEYETIRLTLTNITE